MKQQQHPLIALQLKLAVSRGLATIYEPAATAVRQCFRLFGGDIIAECAARFALFFVLLKKNT